MSYINIEAIPTPLRSRTEEIGVLLRIKSKYIYPINFTANGEIKKAQPGFSRHLVAIKGNSLTVKFETGEKYDFTFHITEARNYRIYIVPTVHTDWGYTDLQDNVINLHRENMKEAINIAKAGGKFVVEVIKQAMDLLPELKEYNISGKIGIQAFPLNMLTGLLDHEEIVRMFYRVRDLRREGFRIEVAALNDVPTAVWSLPTILANIGIKYFIQASNPDRGPLHIINDKIVSPVWWVGPDGSKVLTWFSGGYKGVMPGFIGYHQGLAAGLLDDLPSAEAGIAEFLYYYDSRGYPYNDLLMYGMFIDNDPVNPKFLNIIEEFNAKWKNPELILATSEDFFHVIEKYSINEQIMGDFGDYWADGAASTAQELAISRETKRYLRLFETWATLEYLKGKRYPKEEIDEIWENVFLFDEHTWGDHASVSDPYNPRVIEEWRVKRNYIISAYDRVKELVSGEYVANPNPFTVSEIIGNKYYIVPPMSSVPYTEKEVSVSLDVKDEEVFENQYYKIIVKDGKIVSIFDKELGKELVRVDGYGFNEYVYVEGGKGTSMEKSIVNFRYEGELTKPSYNIYREYSSKLINKFQNDDLVGFEIEAVSYRSRIRKKIILPLHKKEIIIEDLVEKSINLDKEGIYFAFPFNLDSPEILIEEPGVVTNANIEYLPGGCTEWFVVNSFLLLKDKEFNIAFYTHDAPLITLDEPFTGKWRYRNKFGGTLFSYIMNNYWHTNYKAFQGGSFRFRYKLTSGKDLKPSKVYKMFAEPLLSRELSGDLEIEPSDVIVTTFKKWDLGEGVVMRLLEVDNEEKKVKIKSSMLKGWSVYLADMLEQPKNKLGEVGEDGVEVSIPKRSYVTLIFVKNL